MGPGVSGHNTAELRRQKTAKAQRRQGGPETFAPLRLCGFIGRVVLRAIGPNAGTTLRLDPRCAI
jgi:hypothetical protein